MGKLIIKCHRVVLHQVIRASGHQVQATVGSVKKLLLRELSQTMLAYLLRIDWFPQGCRLTQLTKKNGSNNTRASCVYIYTRTDTHIYIHTYIYIHIYIYQLYHRVKSLVFYREIKAPLCTRQESPYF